MRRADRNGAVGNLGFHDIAIRDCLERNHMSKIHVYDDHVFTVLHAPEIGSLPRSAE